MWRSEILRQASMPIASPSYPRGPCRFIDREYFIVTYVSDEEAIREALPEPLEPDSSKLACRHGTNTQQLTGARTWSNEN